MLVILNLFVNVKNVFEFLLFNN